ncbi:MAG: DEAD/DEAH box helicase, partial [Planctomycetota bacterium]
MTAPPKPAGNQGNAQLIPSWAPSAQAVPLFANSEGIELRSGCEPTYGKKKRKMKFTDLGLNEPFQRAVEKLGYETATPIQAKAIPVVLEGRDLIGCAQTGTGKTAAFTLPMLDRLVQSTPTKAPQPTPRPKHARKGSHPNPRAIRALVLSPTRELAAQIGDSLDRYGKFTPLRNTVIFGGVSQFHQVKALRHGVDALVATPGRLLDLVNQGHLDLSNIEILVFDEADQMLDMGFLPDLRRIVKLVPTERQTLMFSATMPDEIRKLAQQWLRDPASIEVAPVATPAERITQSVHLVDKKRKPDLLLKLLKETPRGRTLVFSRTKHGADKIVKKLGKQGVHAEAIHGNKTQGARNRALAKFKGNNPPVLIATDIAARGLDIDNVSHVFNFDLPETPETYVHRIGRTARAGAEGTAVSFCAGDERTQLHQIERLMKARIGVAPTVPGFEPTDPIAAP